MIAFAKPRVNLATEVRELDLDIRITNRLEQAGIETLGQLIQYSAQQLLCIRSFGDKALASTRGAPRSRPAPPP